MSICPLGRMLSCSAAVRLILVMALPAPAQARIPLGGATGPTDSGKTKVVCLFSDGAEDYQLLCKVMEKYLEEALGDGYEFSSTARPAIDEAVKSGESGSPDPPTDGAEAGAPGTPACSPNNEALSGSMDILDAIGSVDREEGKEEVYYFGFAQSDVAYYFRNGGHSLYPTPHHRAQEVVSLARVYREVLHIYSEGLTEESLESFGERLPAWKEVYLGALGSGTLITALNLMSIYRAGGPGLPDGLKAIQQSPSERWSNPSGATPWGGLLVAGIGDPQISTHIKSGAGQLISLSPAQQRHLKSAFSQFYTTGPIKAYGQEGIQFLEIPALLVASKRLPAPVAEALMELLARLDSSPKDGQELFRSLLPSSIRCVEPERFSELADEVFKGVWRYRGESDRKDKSERTKNLVLSQHRATLALREDSGTGEFLVFFVSSILGFLVCRRAFQELKSKKSILEISPLLTGAGALALSIAWIHACLLAVRFLEYRHYMSYGTDTVSPFIRYSYSKLLPMVMQYIASVFSSERLFPLDHIAQLFWLSVPVLLGLSAVSGLFHLVLPPVLDYLRNNLEKGSDMELKDHYIILFWHEHAQDVTAQLRVQERMAEAKDPLIVVLTRQEADVTLPRLGQRKSEKIGEHTLYGLPPSEIVEKNAGILTVVGLNGNPEERASLRMTRPERAKAIIVFPDPDHAEPDAATVLTILRLQEILGEESDTKVLAWCADPRSVDLFQDPRFRLTDACSTEWAWRVLCQATRVGHVSTIYRHLLTSSPDSNEFYEYRLPGGWEGGSFAEVQEAVSLYNSESCGLVPGAEKRRNTLLLVGFFEAADAKRERVQINPAPESRLQPGDALIFLTYVYDQAVAEKLDRSFLKALEASAGC